MVDPDWEDPGDDKVPAITAQAVLAGWKSVLEHYGWLTTKADRILCPEHVASMEYMVRADLEGLPFEEAGAA